jgi:hypothetical protein
MNTAPSACRRSAVVRPQLGIGPTAQKAERRQDLFGLAMRSLREERRCHARTVRPL